ncbi:endocuticle structural glycoprotein SgAbd-2-like [Belonocnema kinseyi]|uniref:endocuticle structural glycoprotein SgAbd-2-like n=1 Tax=Belonocnema kinseyi TaxID=2817044 RepID=UPI00143CF054|nr:endocuticle structural glycoprotein SgAbd-2-like [Belonocnema kinseyi]
MQIPSDPIVFIKPGKFSIMRSLIILIALIGCAVGQQYGNYRGAYPNQQQQYYTTPRPVYPQQNQYQQQPQYQQNQYNAAARQIGIRSQSSDISPDGSYTWQYETENGIVASESGSPKSSPEGQSQAVQGSYSYTAPDGTPITVNYIADENGFRASGAHLPTPPPVPDVIQRAIATLPQTNEGAYDEQQYNRPQQNYNRPQNYNQNYGGGNAYRRFK